MVALSSSIVFPVASGASILWAGLLICSSPVALGTTFSAVRLWRVCVAAGRAGPDPAALRPPPRVGRGLARVVAMASVSRAWSRAGVASALRRAGAYREGPRAGPGSGGGFAGTLRSRRLATQPHWRPVPGLPAWADRLPATVQPASRTGKSCEFAENAKTERDLREGVKRGRLAAVRATSNDHGYGNSNCHPRGRVSDRTPAQRLSHPHDHGWCSPRRRRDCVRAFETESLARGFLRFNSHHRSGIFAA